jgi:hypothetical protein
MAAAIAVSGLERSFDDVLAVMLAGAMMQSLMLAGNSGAAPASSRGSSRWCLSSSSSLRPSSRSA